MISEQIKDVCKIGQGADCCKYLVMGADGFECGKLDSGLRIGIDSNSANMTAQGNNCEGRVL